MFVVSVTDMRACLYIALHSVAMMMMIAQRTVLPSEADLRSMASEPILNPLGTSAMRLEDLITTYTYSHICGSERLNPCFHSFLISVQRIHIE